MDYSQLCGIPLIDTHVHRVHPNRTPAFGNIGGGYIDGPNQESHARQTILYGMVMEALRKEFALSDSASWQQIEQERFKRYNQNPQQYYESLIKNQNVKMYCLEIGSPIGGAAYTENEISYFNASIPENKRCAIVRIDRIMDELLPHKKPFAEFINSFKEALYYHIEKEKTVGLKSCAAYNGGLNIEITDYAAASSAYERICKGNADLHDKKLVHNFVLLESLDAAAEKNLPIQFHTGAGGGNWLDFKTQSPINMIDFLQHPKVKNKVKIVLLHGGHPHEEDTSYLTAQFSNVYTDFSGTFYLCSLKGVERMAALLERTPLDKVMYGSDGVAFPEVSWFAHSHFRRQLSRLLNQLTAEEYITEKRAFEIANMIMHDNALECYSNLSKFL